ncbi:MAG TPA: pitrilysin family protein [Thermoplasmata archaeon]|nr:pitrilysin family protein [Thermoplasmata archaeon]
MTADRDGPLVVERSTLDDGVTLVVQPPPSGAASFSATFLAPSGWGYDARGREGTALLVSELTTAGAGRLDRAALARELDRTGATLSSDCHPEATELTLWGPAEHMDRLLPLLADAVLRPRFEAKELARLRRVLAERQMRERTQPDRCAEKQLFRQLYPVGHPYRETGLGTPRSAARIRREDLRRFHATHFVPEGSSLVVTSDVPIDRLERRANKIFRGWKSRIAPPRPVMREAVPPRGGIERLLVPGGSQVELRIGGPSIPRTDPSFASVTLANEVLGGRSLLSRLFQGLREERGLVYHTSSEVEAMRWGGYWTAQAGMEVTKAEEVTKLLARELERMVETPPPSEELDRIRESLIGSIHLELETTASAHELAVDVAYHDLVPDFYRAWPELLRSVTARQVQAGAAGGIDPTRAATVLAGPFAP